MNNNKKQEFTLRISNANATEMIVILYDIMLEYIEEAEQRKEEADEFMYKDSIRKIRACLNELISSLHMEYELAGNILQLYFFCLRRLVHAESKKDTTALSDIQKVIEQLENAYAQISPQNTDQPIMKNTQSVYAGLTYGRNTLTENVSEKSSNRGMLV